MSKSFCLSRPSFSASTKASETAIIEMPRIMLLQIFAACPAPAPPACTIVFPIFSRIGLGFPTAASRRHDRLPLLLGHRLRLLEARIRPADHESERGTRGAADAAGDRRVDHQ